MRTGSRKDGLLQSNTSYSPLSHLCILLAGQRQEVLQQQARDTAHMAAHRRTAGTFFHEHVTSPEKRTTESLRTVNKKRGVSYFLCAASSNESTRLGLSDRMV